jgi:hypothetical protein
MGLHNWIEKFTVEWDLVEQWAAETLDFWRKGLDQRRKACHLARLKIGVCGNPGLPYTSRRGGRFSGMPDSMPPLAPPLLQRSNSNFLGDVANPVREPAPPLVPCSSVRGGRLTLSSTRAREPSAGSIN